MTTFTDIDGLVKKWNDYLEEGTPITNKHKRRVTAALLENASREFRTASREIGETQSLLEDAVPPNSVGSGNVQNFDPVLISLIRRSAPNLMAFDMCGVQPLAGPNGLIFALRSMYANSSNAAIAEAHYNEVNTAWTSVVTGANTLGQKHTGYLPSNGTSHANLASLGIYNFAGGMSTAQGEALGTDGNAAIAEMSLTIDKVTAIAKERKIAAGYTLEMAQDMKSVHGLDAEGEISSMLTTEVLAEINREIIRTINVSAKAGAQAGTVTPGVFDLDTDSNGRWMVERFKGLMFHIDKECNRIAKETRRGKGNMLICSADVASALQMAGILDYTPALNSNNLEVDDTGNTFAGVLNGRIKVYIDPYADDLLNNTAGLNYLTVGYKGANPMDSGIFYCPYVPLQKVRAVNPGSFHPRIGFLTRYAVVANPFSQGLNRTNPGDIVKDSNCYYRRNIITNLT